MVGHGVVEKIRPALDAVEEENFAELARTVASGIAAARVQQQRREWQHPVAVHQTQLTTRDCRSSRGKCYHLRFGSHQQAARVVFVVQDQVIGRQEAEVC